MKKYLYCPKCGIHVFFSQKNEDERIIFYVSTDKKILLKNPENSISDIDPMNFKCMGCSWEGGINNLIERPR